MNMEIRPIWNTEKENKCIEANSSKLLYILVVQSKCKVRWMLCSTES